MIKVEHIYIYKYIYIYIKGDIYIESYTDKYDIEIKTSICS